MAEDKNILLRHLKLAIARCTSVTTSKISELTEAISKDLQELDDAKQDSLTFDSTPIKDSTNPVTSDGIYKAIEAGSGVPIISATSTDGVIYTATVDNMESLVVGKEFIIVPNYTSTVINPKLNVNGLGDKYLRCPIGGNNATTTTAASASWLYVGKPVSVRWNGTFWITDVFRADASSLCNSVPIDKGGTGATTIEAARTALEVVAFTEQTLTDEQKAQVRENIGIADAFDQLFDAKWATMTPAEEVAY